MVNALSTAQYLVAPGDDSVLARGVDVPLDTELVGQIAVVVAPERFLHRIAHLAVIRERGKEPVGLGTGVRQQGDWKLSLLVT